MNDFLGFPPQCDRAPGIDRLGDDCRIAPNVTVMRYGAPEEGRGILLGHGVTLFDHVRLVLGDLALSPHTNLVLGDGVIVNVGSYLSGEGGLLIEEGALIGPHCRILSAGHAIHGHDPMIVRNPLTHAPVRIGRGAWLGGGSTVLQGVTIGEGAVVGAGSVVTQHIPAYAVAVGNPARVRHYRAGHAPAPWWRLRVRHRPKG